MNEKFDSLLRAFKAEADTLWPNNFWQIANEGNLQNMKAFDAFVNLLEEHTGPLALHLINVYQKQSLRIERETGQEALQVQTICTPLIRTTLKYSRRWPAETFRLILEAISDVHVEHKHLLMPWYIHDFLSQLKHYVESNSGTIDTLLYSALETFRNKIREVTHPGYSKEKRRVETAIAGIEALVGGKPKNYVRPVFFQEDDVAAPEVNAFLERLPLAEQEHWCRLLAHAQKASGGKPTDKFLKTAEPLLASIGATVFAETLAGWCRYLAGKKEIQVEHHSSYGGREYTYTSHVFLHAANADMLKGLVWMAVHTISPALSDALARLADRCYQKIPGTGPAAAGLGNAVLYTLASSNTFEGIAHLSRLRLRIRQSNTQKLIEKYLDDIARQRGMSIADLEDLAADDFGLRDGRLEQELDGYRAVLAIESIGKTSLSWFKPDGTLLKSAPAALKTSHNADLKALNSLAKSVQTATTTQRDRFDRMLRSERRLSYAYFRDHYLQHGLLGWLTRRLIWRFERDGRSAAAFFTGETWRIHTGEILDWAGGGSTVQLWHPVQSDLAEVQGWRAFMEEFRITQPLKQAFREIYLLTEAELRTRTYSNRFAAHILKQHQFNSLAKLRGWSYRLLGAYDDGLDNSIAALDLPEYGLRAEFWVNEVNLENAWNDTGIWNYVATDQLRYRPMTGENPVNLIDIPRQVFSEVLRDVDMFVGVASVGNDPQWRDSGGLQPVHRNYWESYSFGDLSEMAKTRKEVLARLLPRLKIARVAEIRDKFLVVRGKLRTYKIHIGSTNILMEPNDQYLCIVPDRRVDAKTENVFLPFEGDQGLAVILSKAFLLAEDDQITDLTITRQIR